MKTATNRTATNGTNNNTVASVSLLPAGKKQAPTLPAGKNSLKFGATEIQGATLGELSSNILSLTASIDRLGYPSLCAIAVINGLKNELKIKSPAVCVALGRPQYEGKPIDYATPHGIGRRISRLTAYITGLKAIANPFLLLENVTDYQVGADILARALEDQGVVFEAESSTFIDDKESDAFKIKAEANKATKEAELAAKALDANNPSDPTMTDSELAASLTESVVIAELAITDVIAAIANGYIMTSDLAQPATFKELKALTAQNDAVIKALLEQLNAALAA